MGLNNTGCQWCISKRKKTILSYKNIYVYQLRIMCVTLMTMNSQASIAKNQIGPYMVFCHYTCVMYPPKHTCVPIHLHNSHNPGIQ